MNIDELFRNIKLKKPELINVLLQTIETDKRMIALYEREITKAERASDFNRVAELKQQKLKEANESLTKNRTLLLKIICEQAFQVVSEI